MVKLQISDIIRKILIFITFPLWMTWFFIYNTGIVFEEMFDTIILDRKGSIIDKEAEQE